jgi:hypothetical protein
MTARFLKSNEMIRRDLLAAFQKIAIFTVCAGCFGFLAIVAIQVAMGG